MSVSASSVSGDVLREAVAKDCHERLRTRIDAQTLSIERKLLPRADLVFGRELEQQRLVDQDRQACVAALYRMADAITLSGIEEQHLIRFGHYVGSPHMPHVDAAIREHEMRTACAFLLASCASHSPRQTTSCTVAVRVLRRL